MGNEYKKYLAHKNRTCNRKDRLGNPIEFRLTFTEWKQIWEESGHADERGTRLGQYCMARFDDLGHYEVGNVKIQLSSENFREAALRGHACHDKGKKRGPLSEAVKNKIKEARVGMAWSTKSAREDDGRKRPLTEEHKQKMREYWDKKRQGR